jgi:RNA polymerase II subunit A-like phosphatase
MTKTVRLGNRLRYPITIVKLLKAPGHKIKKQEALLEYSFKWMREVGDSIHGETWQEEQTTIVTWESPTDGELKHWLIKEGQRIVADRGVMEVQEECSHEIQFQGLCGICGKDMTEVNWAAETRDTARAPISMVHDQTSLTVSADQAQRTEQELQRRLLQNRKLSLVVDLDQTIIQACIDPTVGEWQKDPTNPNYESVKEVKSFQLDDGPTELARRCSYYIKMRPGLEGFLRRISEMYEMHVYTMGTRAYAKNVARVVDPDKKLFGNRVISRDENGNIFAKNLQRLFPVSTRMVAIIDDRSDVWPRNRPNLIKVSPYEFFKGIGDINSSFLPKRQDLLSSGATANGVSQKGRNKEPPAKSNKDDVALDATFDMTGGDDPNLTKRQLEEQERTFEKQIHDRPLQALQEKLDREDEEAEKASQQSEDGSESRSSSPPAHRHRALQDDDEELKYLERHLTALHSAYYAEYDANRASHLAAPTAANTVDLSSVPDAGRILDELKGEVLRGCKIVLSGVLPRGVDIYRSEIGLQITSFGAELRPKITRDVTHLVVNAAQPGREKLLAARRRPHIKIVGQEWLAACFKQWEAVDEAPYLFTARLVEEERDGKGVVSDEEEEEELEEGEIVKDQAVNGASPSGGPRLKLVLPSGEARVVEPDEGDDEPDDDAEEGGGGEEIEEGLLPSDLPDGQSSPIDGLKTFNWGDADEELAEFLASGSSDEDDDQENKDDEEDEDFAPPQEGEEESSSSEEERRSRRSRSRSVQPAGARASPGSGRKRKDREVDGDEEEAEGGETPAKRLRRTESQRASSLRSQYVAGEQEGGSGLPTPGRSEEQEGDGNEGGGEEDEEEMDFDAAELEAEFEKEFEAEFEKMAEEEAEAEAEAEAETRGEDVVMRDTEKG